MTDTVRIVVCGDEGNCFPPVKRKNYWLKVLRRHWEILVDHLLG